MTQIRTIIGLMSGTSMDGIDAAILRTDGEALVEQGLARTFPYSREDRQILGEALVAGRGIVRRTDRPEPLPAAERLVTDRHAEAVAEILARAGLAAADVDAIGFHGQTVFHAPERGLTVQIGDGAGLAERTGIPVVWDMRADDVAAGGQGAPLVPIYHRALALAAGLDLPAAFLNLGGVANITWVGGGEGLVAFDTGPGNALLDDWVRQRTGADFDAGGRLAATGRVSERHLETLLENGYFDAPAPKSLDRNAFDTGALAALSDADGAATLAALTIRAIVRGLALCPAMPKSIVTCGGGRRNEHLMQRLRDAAPMPVLVAEDIGFDGDAIEAQAFAYLAARRLDSLPITFPGTTGVPRPLTGGRVSAPGP